MLGAREQGDELDQVLRPDALRGEQGLDVGEDPPRLRFGVRAGEGAVRVDAELARDEDEPVARAALPREGCTARAAVRLPPCSAQPLLRIVLHGPVRRLLAFDSDLGRVMAVPT